MQWNRQLFQVLCAKPVGHIYTVERKGILTSQTLAKHEEMT